VDNERFGTMALSPAGDRDLSWLDFDFPVAVSPDGKSVFLEEQSEQAGSDHWVGLRSTDGSPPVRLGEGGGGGVSPDGKWMAQDIDSIPETTFLLPIGAGERKALRHPGVHSYGFTPWFMPDGQSVLFIGIEPGHLPRSYLQSLQGGPARPVTPEGILAGVPLRTADICLFSRRIRRMGSTTFNVASPGLFRVRIGIYGRLVGRQTRVICTYLHTRTGPPSQIWRLDISTDEEKPVRQLTPHDPAGILEIFNLVMTPDAKTFVYGYDRYLSELYVVDGLH